MTTDAKQSAAFDDGQKAELAQITEVRLLKQGQNAEVAEFLAKVMLFF